MADVQSNIHVNIDTSGALASLKALQRQISAFHTQMAKSGTAANAVAANQAQNLMNAINATGQFQASMRTVRTSTEAFTDSLEKNKLTSREYFRYTGAATKTFGRLFRSEFETINKVARERVKDIQTQYIKMGRGANGALQAIAVRPLTLDMQNLGTQTAMAAQKQQLLNQLLRQGSTNLLNFGKNTQWAGRQLMVGFTVPLVMLGAAASKTFMQLEEQAIRFKRVYGEMFTTQEETDKMVKNVQLLAREYTKYGVAVEKTMEMAADAAAMGKMGAELLAQVTEATRLAVLGGVEQEDALKTTISVTNAFGVAAEDLAEKIDFLNAVENQTVVSIEDLTIAIPKAGPVVKQLGGNVEDLAFFLTAMKEGGINASEGANALKSGLASLINPSDKASKMLMGLGVNIKGIVEANAGDVKSTVVDFAAALDTLDPLNRARAIEQLFGKFQFSRLSTLFQNVTKEGTQASRVLELTKATTEELAILSERELGRIEESTSYKFKKAVEDLKVSLAPVGEQFLKALTPIVEFVGKILEKFNGLSDGSKKFVTILTVALGAIGPVALMSFGLLANGVANIIKLFAVMKSTFNRAGSSSQILGQQTDYLTKEQIEASAVAASLDQVHQRLRQTFTSETVAVNMLANAYRRAIAAQVGFTGPVGRGMPRGGPQSARYSTGTTRVPGQGNQDTVPAMLTPGEAVIPARAAQDPSNRPVIARMIAGQTVQGFNTGSGNVQPDGPEKLSFAHAAAPIKYNNVDDIPKNFKDDAKGLKARGIAQAYGYTGIGFDIPAAMNSELKAKSPAVDVRAYEAAIRNPESIKTMTARLMGPPLQLGAGEALRVSSQVRSNLLASLAVLPDGTKINDNLVYRRMGSIRKGILGGLARDPQNKTIIQRMLDPHGIGAAAKSSTTYDPKPATPKELREAVAKSANASKILPAIDRLIQFHPDTPIEVVRDKQGNIIGYKRPEVSRSNPTKKPTKFSNASLVDGSFVTGRSGGDTGAVTIRADSKSSKAALRSIAAVGGITTYGKKDTDIKDVGRSNPKHRHITGVYETADGKGKVFVKPMINLENALAEQRAATILRDAHGLEVPDQRITMVKDPVTKRLVYALESAFDPKFAGKNMPVTFKGDEYFRQLLASSLRGDKDLGRGNLGGRMAPDVGTAYIYDEASQYNQRTGKERVVSDAIKSVGHQALINVGGIPGSGAKKFFADSTRAIAAGMTPEEYQRRMLAEIDRVIPKLRETIAKFGLTGDEAKPYKAIIERLEAARNIDWAKIQTAHATAGKVAITPDELILNKKTRKTKKPRTEKLPKTVKSSGGPSDTVMTTAPKSGEQIVKEQKRSLPKRVGKTIIPGFSEAPTILNPDLQERLAKRLEEKSAKTQSTAAANSTRMYGTVAPTAIEKSIRKQNAKRAAKGMPLLGLTKDMSASANVFTRSMKNATKVLNKNTVSNAIKASKEKNAARKEERAKARAEAKAKGTKTPKMGVGGMAMAAGGIAMMGSMMPGAIGEMSQKLMMPLMGLGMILPMLGSKAGVLAVGLMATVGAIVKLRMEFDKAQDEAIKLANTMGSSKDAIKGYAEFAGNVSAGEIMQRRSQEKFGLLGAKPGKTTFGQSFVEGKTGKALMDSISTSLKKGNQKGAVSDLTNQLMTSVLSGAIDASQAKSIALNIGQKTGNYGLGFAVTANINEIIGPNGENLTKDPLQIRVNLINEKTKQNTDVFNTMQEKSGRGGFLNIGAFGEKTGIGGMALAGAGTGAAIGAGLGLLGGPLAPLTSSAGALIGTGLGAVGGAVAGYFAKQDSNEKAAAMSGAYVGSQRSQLEQQQELMDSLDLYYQKKLKELEVEGKIAEMKEMQKDYDEDRLALATKGKDINTQIMTQYGQTKGNVRAAIDTGLEKLLTQRYKGTDEMQYLDAAKLAISESGLTSEQQHLIRVKMSTGELTPSQQVFLFTNFGDDKEVKDNYMNIIANFSARTGDEATRVMGMFSNPDGTPNTKMQAEFIGKVSTQANDAEAEKYIGFFAEVANTNGVFDMTASLNYYLANPTVAKDTQAIIDNIENNEGKLTLDVMTNFLPENVMGAIDTEYFEKLSQPERLTYLKEIATIVNIPDPVIETDPDFLKWQKEGAMYKGVSYSSKSIGEQIFAYRQFQPYTITQESIQQAALAPPKETTGDGSKVQSSPLDDLIKRLRDVRKNQIKVTEGFDASFKSLGKLFGGNKTIDIYSGIENDMRKLGAGEDLIELIVGMDPKEYEKHKKKLFEFDEKGNIKKLKDGARSIGDALQSIALGTFVSDQQKMSKQIGNQVTALQRLQAAGVEGSVALEAVADATFAAAIANKKLTDKELKKIVKAADAATIAKRRMAAIDLATGETTELDNRVKLLTGMTNNLSQFSKDQISAILDSPALQAVMIEFGIDNDRFKNLLQKTTDKANVDLKFKSMTIPGMQDIFNQGFSNAMESFDVQETKLQLQFDIDTKQLNKDISDAENKIALAQFEIDDKEADLKRIADQEEKINEKYDERIKSLDEVEKANASISAQQKGQLTLADALTSGDIAAAARAAQEMRAQQAADAVTKQKEAVEKSRELELSSLRSKDGKSRKELEKEIKDLQDQIFEIEEKQLEPAEELIRLRQIKLAQDIENLTVLGKTRDAWEGIKNLVDLAIISSEKFVKSMQDALDILPSLITAYNNDKSDTESLVSATEEPTPTPTPTPTPKPTPKTPEELQAIVAKLGRGQTLTADERAAMGLGPAGAAAPAAPVAAPKATPKPTAAPSGKVPDFVYIADPNGFKRNPTPVPAPKDLDKNGIPDNIQAPKSTPKATPKPLLPVLVPPTQKKTLVPGTGVYNGSMFIPPQYKAKGGIIPKMFALGGFAKGTDTIPAMLTPGEFVMSKYAVDTYGVDNMNKINSGDPVGGTVYNNTYTLTVNAKTNANPNDIAQAVMSTIKKVDDRRIRGVSLNGR